MSRGPLRRATAGVGLVALLPTALLLATGALAPADAAIRAVVTVVVLLLLGRLADRGLQRLISMVERPDVAGATRSHDDH